MENEKGIKDLIEILTFIMGLSEEEEKQFFEDNPEFLEEYSVDEERRILLKEKMYREILKRIKQK